MIATLIAVLISIFIWQRPFDENTNTLTPAITMLGLSIPFLYMMPLGTMLAWGPMQKAEQNLTPRILEMFRKDKSHWFSSNWLMIFPLLTIALVLDALFTHLLPTKVFFIAWILLFGFSIDQLKFFVRRIWNYLNPSASINMFTQQAYKSIQNEKEIDLCNWMDGIAEIALKGVQRHSTSTANQALDEEQKIARTFLQASKSIAHHAKDKQTESFGITDKVSYTMFYLYQRLDMIFEKALQNKLETTCSHIVTILGKIAIDAAKYDVSMASVPLRFLGKCGKNAQDAGLNETALTASCAFLEIAKTILSDIDVKYYEIKDPFLSIINGMEVLEKSAFKKDKSLSINVLMQPFKDLKALFETDKMKDHQDTPVIMQNINRVLGEFEALQLVMTTIPPLSELTAEPPKDTLM